MIAPNTTTLTSTIKNHSKLQEDVVPSALVIKSEANDTFSFKMGFDISCLSVFRIYQSKIGGDFVLICCSPGKVCSQAEKKKPKVRQRFCVHFYSFRPPTQTEQRQHCKLGLNCKRILILITSWRNRGCTCGGRVIRHVSSGYF